MDTGHSGDHGHPVQSLVVVVFDREHVLVVIHLQQ